MEPKKKRCLEGAAYELVHSVLIKREVEWIAEEAHAPDLAHQEITSNMESLLSIKTEEDVSYTHIPAHVVQEFTPVPQTVEFIKTELILEEEFTDEMNDSEAFCEQNALALADELELNAGSSTQTRNQHILTTAHGQRASASVSDKESEEFPCDLCERTFSKKSSLNNHKSAHAKGQMKIKTSEFVCEVCGSSFTQKGNLNVHMVRKHLSKAQSKTPGSQTADNSINTQTEEFIDGDAGQEGVAQRGESKSDTKTETCEVCHYIYPTAYIRAHMRLAHSSNSPKHKCEFCSRPFQKKCRLEIHLLTHAPDKEREAAKFECGVCSQSFNSKDVLRRHLNIHDKDRKREFACNSCDSAFYTRSHLLNHKNIHSRGTYHCKVCGKLFTQRESLQVHMLRLQHFGHKPQLTPRPSNDGGVAMKRELMSDEEFIDEEKDKDLVSHVGGLQQSALAADDGQCARVGLAEDLVNCEVCHNSYPEELINTHIRIAHTDRAYKCPFCPNVCLSKSTLKSHINIHDNDRTRPYACEQCGFKFFTKGGLDRHMISQHTKNRKPEFNCELCEKVFYTKHGLKAHVRTHAGISFNCEVCGKSFTRWESVRNHILQKHTAKMQPLTPDAQTANDDSVHTKKSGYKRLIRNAKSVSYEKFLAEVT